MNKHITETQLEGYVLKTLTDAEREHIARHTADCPDCRAILQEREVQLRRIQYELQTEMRQVRPSPQMNFDAIASNLPRSRRFTMLQQTSTRALTGALALAVLVIGFITLNNFWQQSAELAPIMPDVPDTDVVVDSSQLPARFSDGRSAPGWYTENIHYSSWNSTVVSSEYEAGIDTAVSYQGDRSGYIQSQTDNPVGEGTVAQTIRADAYRGQRIRLSAVLKAAPGTDGAAAIYVEILDADGYLLNKDNTRKNGVAPTQDWLRQEMILDVPENSAFITFGALLDGNGRVWIDDWAIETVSGSVSVTADYSAPHNLGLESAVADFPQYWLLAGSAPEKYQVGMDNAVFSEGHSSASLQSDTANFTEFGTLMQNFSPDAFRGQRVRLTADIKSENAGRVMPWMRVDGPHGDVLQFDNNDAYNHYLTGTVDWTPYEIVLDVPEESANIAFGLMVVGKGKGWIDNVQFEIVGADVSLTNQEYLADYEAALRSDLTDKGSTYIGSPLSGWFEPDAQLETVEVGVDTAVSPPDSNLPSVYIRSSDANAASSGDLAQTISAEKYRGQRISLMLYLRGDAITGQAAPWLRVDSFNNVYAAANVGSLAMSGSQEWTPYELVLDVPETAFAITFGVSLEGAGTVWIGDVQLETVGDAVPTTNMFDVTEPVNLGFEE